MARTRSIPIVLILFAVYSLNLCADEPQPLTLDIATYNILAGRYVRNAHKDIPKYFLKTKPDIICLQEIRYRHSAGPRGTGHAADLAKQLGPDYTWAAAPRPIIHHHPTQSGPAIVVRGKLIKTEELKLEPERAYAILAEVEIDNQPMIIVSAHFHSTSGATVASTLTTEDDRVREVAHLINRLKDETKPIIIGCDANAMPFFPSANTLATHYTDVAAKAGNPQPTYTVRNVGIRIDYLYTSDHFTVQSSETSDLPYSDHKPVTATILLRKISPKATINTSPASTAKPGK